MDIPEGWTITAKGNYLCMCYQFKTDNIKELASHKSEFEGYCARGLKCISKNQFECICNITKLDIASKFTRNRKEPIFIIYMHADFSRFPSSSGDRYTIACISASCPCDYLPTWVHLDIDSGNIVAHVTVSVCC